MNDIVLSHYNLFDIVLTLLFITGMVFLSQKLRIISVKFSRLFFLVSILHFILTIAYFLMSFVEVSDARTYFLNTYYTNDNWGDSFSQGTEFIHFLLYPFINVFNISYFGCYLIFSFLSLLGFYFLSKVLIHITAAKWSKWYYLLLLPNLHFWTVAIGKDSLMFFGISLFLYASYFKKKWTYFIIPVLLIGFIRLHILFFVFSAMVTSQLFLNKQLKVFYKLVIIGIVVLAGIVLLPFLLERIGVTENRSLTAQIERLENDKLRGESSVDMSGSSMLIKYPSYVFRPLFFDARGLTTLIASFENLIWVLIFYKIIKNLSLKTVPTFRPRYWFCFFAILCVTLPNAYFLTNLGIANRQKVMIVPFLFALLFMSLYRSEEKKTIN